jgi:hypothetical protein
MAISRNWRNQFNGFNLESEEKILNGLGFADCSWGNDASPKFERGDLRLWINYDNLELRESETGFSKKYCLTLVYDCGDDIAILETDSLDDIVKNIQDRGSYCIECGTSLENEDENGLCDDCQEDDDRTLSMRE